MYINKPKLRIIMIDAVILLFFIAVFSYAGLAYAKDLGVYGNSYRISEEDVEEEIGRKLKIFEQSGELKKFQEKYQKEVVRQIKEPNRVVGIKNAEENRTRKYPSYFSYNRDLCRAMLPINLGTSSSTSCQF